MVGAFQPGVVSDSALLRKVLDGEGAKIAYFSSIDLRHFRVGGKAGRPWSNI